MLLPVASYLIAIITYFMLYERNESIKRNNTITFLLLLLSSSFIIIIIAIIVMLSDTDEVMEQSKLGVSGSEVPPTFENQIGKISKT